MSAPAINTTAGQASVGCTLCPDGSAPLYFEKKLHLSFLPNTSAFQNITCGTLYRGIGRYVFPNPMVCATLHQTAANICGCGASPSSAFEGCSMCQDGTHLANGSKVIDFFANDNQFLVDSINPQITCDRLQTVLTLAPVESELCELGQEIGFYCGCPSQTERCQLSKPIPSQYRKKRLNFLRHYLNISLAEPNCATFEFILSTLPKHHFNCDIIKLREFLCNDDEYMTYFGADTDVERAFLALLPRMTSTLSLLASVVLLISLYTCGFNRLYHKLMLALVLFDIVTAVSWIPSTSPVQTEYDGDPIGIYGAAGNDSACLAQGFGIQFGMTSIYYNLALVIYYYLTVCNGMKDKDLKARTWWFLFPPFVVGLLFALAAVPYYSPSFRGCFVVGTSFIDFSSDGTTPNNRRGLSWGFVIVPIVSTATIMTGFLIYGHIRFRRRFKALKAVRESAELLQQRSALERKVLQQSFLYFVAFAITWIPLAVYEVVNALKAPYWMAVLLGTVLPLQGFTNAVIFYIPRIQSCWKRVLREIEEEDAAGFSLQTSLGWLFGGDDPYMNYARYQEEYDNCYNVENRRMRLSDNNGNNEAIVGS